MTEDKKPIIIDNSMQKIERPDFTYFKGLDGKEYRDPQALQQANTEWLRQNHRYISPWTGKEYSDYQAMRQEEEAYWQSQIIKPKDRTV